jgi:hypothetical protein
MHDAYIIVSLVCTHYLYPLLLKSKDWKPEKFKFLEAIHFAVRKGKTIPSRVSAYGVLRHFQQYFSYLVVVSFIDGVNTGIRLVSW